MIKYQLNCANGHSFESWFKDSAAYDVLAAAGRLTCPECGGAEVSKAIMAPALLTSSPVHSTATDEQRAGQAKALREALVTLREHVERTADYVGDTFAEEARKIHYGEIEQRAIYGETSAEDAKALLDEGVEIGRIPWLPKDDA